MILATVVYLESRRIYDKMIRNIEIYPGEYFREIHIITYEMSSQILKTYSEYFQFSKSNVRLCYIQI